MLHTIGLIGVDGALYQAMEFTGPAIKRMSIDGRFTMCNMAIEAGAKCGIVGYDETTAAYLHEPPRRQPRRATAGVELNSDPDADYAREIDIDAVGRRAHRRHAAPALEHRTGGRAWPTCASTRS